MTLGSPHGSSSIRFRTPPQMLAVSTVAGPKEGKGPLGDGYDLKTDDDILGEDSWEKAERKMLSTAIDVCAQKAGMDSDEPEALLAGDLLNQIVSSGYAARRFDVPFLGLYGACSTFVEAIILGAMMVDGGYRDPVMCATSSHHNTAERQYRMPTEFAGQRPPQSQWTVTGAGACVLSANSGTRPASGFPVVITEATVGRVVDYGIRDPMDMGSAMAPAACDTLLAHFHDTQKVPGDYDIILTGDLGQVGHTLVQQLLSESGLSLDGASFEDAGLNVFSPEQNVYSGGSGCACIALAFNAWIWKEMQKGRIEKALMLATGAMHSPTACQQGESIPGIAHAVAVEVSEGGKEEKVD